jgi:hypothetical protein
MTRYLALLVLLTPWTLAAEDFADASYRPVPPPNDRFHQQTERNVRVTTAVPSAQESQAIFGIQLYRNNVQPVWVKIENLGDEPLFFLPIGLDASYYTPVETAARNYFEDLLRNRALDKTMVERSMGLDVAAGETRSGYIFSRVDEGTKSFNVDVFAREAEPYRMTFFVPVPGLRLDHYEVDVAGMYSEDQLVQVDLDGLAAELEALPCCVRDKKDKDYGDPLNIAFVGEIKDLYYALLRSGWDETETIYTGSLLKTGMSALAGGEYRYSPVSALYVFGRPQDAAFQRARSSINERNHLRIWLTPLRLDGVPVWIGQISRDIGVRLTLKTITTHKIDPDVDETREFLIEDLAYSQGLAAFGYAPGVGAAPYEEPRGNLTGDPYFTDGLRGVMWISPTPIGFDELEVIDMGWHPESEP